MWGNFMGRLRVDGSLLDHLHGEFEQLVLYRLVCTENVSCVGIYTELKFSVTLREDFKFPESTWWYSHIFVVKYNNVAAALYFYVSYNTVAFDHRFSRKS